MFKNKNQLLLFVIKYKISKESSILDQDYWNNFWRWNGFTSYGTYILIHSL